MEAKITEEKDQILEYTKETIVALIEKGFVSALGLERPSKGGLDVFSVQVKGIYDAYVNAANK